MPRINEYSVDPATGFLEKNEKNSFGPREKTAFLKDFKRTGDQTKCAHTLGYEFEIIDWHLQNDQAFNSAFKATLLAIRHEIEGNMLHQARKGKSKEAQMWLQAHFPETYKPSAAKPKKTETLRPSIQALYDKLDAEKAAKSGL